MGFVEAVVRELVEKVPNLLRFGLIDAILCGARKEFGALSIHRLLDLLTHRPAQKVSAAEGIPGHLPGDLHHLFLIDDDALRFIEDIVDQRVEFIARLSVILDVAIFRNVLHRTWPIQRHKRNDILDAGRLKLPKRVAHARAFHLEHGDRVGGAVEII